MTHRRLWEVEGDTSEWMKMHILRQVYHQNDRPQHIAQPVPIPVDVSKYVPEDFIEIESATRPIKKKGYAFLSNYYNSKM
jgi:hypothetical protein